VNNGEGRGRSTRGPSLPRLLDLFARGPWVASGVNLVLYWCLPPSAICSGIPQRERGIQEGEVKLTAHMIWCHFPRWVCGRAVYPKLLVRVGMLYLPWLTKRGDDSYHTDNTRVGKLDFAIMSLALGENRSVVCELRGGRLRT
jgi:hypothetical protein